MEPVAVFIDYQNVYRGARAAFAPTYAPSRVGQIDPTRLGELLVHRRQRSSEVSDVRLYRGLPESNRDPRSYSAARRQVASWDAQTNVTAITRPLRYPPTWPTDPPREKGIDVQLAVDLVLGAVDFDYDVAIVFSADTDLVPALDAVIGLGRHVEVVGWKPEAEPGRRINSHRQRIWCHWLTKSDFDFVADLNDYNIARL